MKEIVFLFFWNFVSYRFTFLWGLQFWLVIFHSFLFLLGFGSCMGYMVDSHWHPLMAE
jgi:uncharacterized SAM-binding protein YcdF (DUF218 family)